MIRLTRSWVEDENGHWTTNEGEVLCPDLARSEWFGAADNLRGRFVLLIFRLLDRVWPV